MRENEIIYILSLIENDALFPGNYKYKNKFMELIKDKYIRKEYTGNRLIKKSIFVLTEKGKELLTKSKTEN